MADCLDLLFTVKKILRQEVESSASALGEIKSVQIGSLSVLPPLAKYPVIILSPTREGRQHERAAKQSRTGYGESYYWSILVADTNINSEVSLISAMLLWRELREVIDKNYTWNGIVIDTNYDGDIEYASAIIGDGSYSTIGILIPLVSTSKGSDTEIYMKKEEYLT